ncbi:zinc finger protein 11-like isoform X2 [Dunckerocampus dactyliophorus]|uniref:zinc finger protein 11-like isoform X2 n=1 Tax=Dunckerocampus dactyliophorus TaxID=161453 RepID=UPI0024062598|nr:zinc finger protein 11-like isoform X2 [Dunckerocampus dactyliophorus]
MDPYLFDTLSKASPLPLASLRLLVPPLQLLSASMWQALKKQDVMSYWEVAEFVSLVMDMVPELLMYKHRMQLNMGLRARYILQLCKSDQPLQPDFILSLLDMIKVQHHSVVDVNALQEEETMIHFQELIQVLLKDADKREYFFLDVFPAQYGTEYDEDLQTLFWEFLCQLTQLLPVPDLKQTVCWLGASVLGDCVQSLSETNDLKVLLQHHKHLRHLDQHVPPTSMGDKILSSLSAFSACIKTKSEDQPNKLDFSDDTHIPVPLVDEITIEVIAEVETDEHDVLMGENGFEGPASGVVAKDALVVQTEDTPTGLDESEVEKGTDKNTPSDSAKIIYAEVQRQSSTGPHDCPDCDKKFKFASSLTAHRVIHTGERPHRCYDCGRCFSFRQSLDRHRNTHKSGRRYDCIVCGETFLSLSARTEHKQSHMMDGVYACKECDRKFIWELALVRHMKTHTMDVNANSPPESCEVGQEISGGEADAPLDDIGDAGNKTNGNEVISLVKVRTSGRKRRPTMKVQVINLQKHMSSKRKQEVTRENPPASKLLPFNCSEHSYGTPSISSKDADQSFEADGTSATFSCPKCSFCHSDEEHLQHHMESVHFVDDEGRFNCRDCAKSFMFLSLLKAHQRIHTGEQPFVCPQCGRRFSFKQSLERHKVTHKPGRKYECLICGEFFKSVMAQRSHMSVHMKNGEFVCSECGRKFAWKSALVRHLKTHGEGDNKDEYSHKCPHCELSFSCASYLNRHLRTHQEERAHSCNCGKSFAYRAALTAHQRIHQKDRPHVCTQCGKGFLYKGGLLNHMKIHSEEMPFMCSYCGKCFKRERNMKKHERCHTRENVFSCSQCDKSFVYKATLTRHELTHSGERPYLCSDCGKGFFSHAELLKHERFHTGHKPFQCPHCEKRFTQSCYLTIHLRYHTGARPYSCIECDKSFLSANRLKRHKQTHTGEKPYVCVECGKGFRQSYHLKMHQRTHIKIT